jgi:hypothetical protein
MGRTFSKETSGTEIVTGIIGNVDIGAMITKVIEREKEISQTQEILNRIKTYITTQDGGYTKILQSWITQDYDKVQSKILEALRSGLQTQASLLRDQIMLGILGYSGSATMSGMYSKFDSTFRGLSTLYDCTFGIQNEFLEDNALRYWHKTLGPNKPSVEEALRLVRFGFMDRSQWIINKREEDGVTDGYADKIFTTLFRQPDERTAFSLWKRGVLTEADYKEIMVRLGWDKEKIDTITESFYHLPSFTELNRLADFVPMDSIYLGEVLEKNGVKEADIPRLVSYLQRRPLREETRGIIGRYLWEYASGRITFEHFVEDLTDLGVLPTELDIYKDWAAMQYTDQLMDLQLDTIKQKTIKGQYETAEAIKDDLMALGLDETWSNLQAWDWYWAYVYVEA